MSRDIFANVARSPRIRTDYGFAVGSPHGAQDGGSPNLIPWDPEVERLMDAMDAESDAERARQEVEMDTPENRQKASEAKAAERERRRINFHFGRAMSSHIHEGWRQIGEELTDEKIRVYTTDYRRRRFWGIKPAGMGMYDFWEHNDPDVERYDDNIAMTWANPLIPPPVTAADESIAVIWAGRGLNPDVTAPELHIAEVPPPTKAATKPKRHPKAPGVNPVPRVRKSTTKSPKANNNNRKSLADKIDAGQLGLNDQVRDMTETTHAGEGTTSNKAAPQRPDAQQNSATEDKYSATFKRPRGRPAVKAKPAANNETSTPMRPQGRPATSTTPIAKDQDELPSKRPRGRPAASTRLVTKDQDALPPKRPRGRPPAKGKPPKQNKTPAVKGNARVTKSSQAERHRPAAPSTHKMRTRGEGPAELLELA